MASVYRDCFVKRKNTKRCKLARKGRAFKIKGGSGFKSKKAKAAFKKLAAAKLKAAGKAKKSLKGCLMTSKGLKIGHRKWTKRKGLKKVKRNAWFVGGKSCSTITMVATNSKFGLRNGAPVRIKLGKTYLALSKKKGVLYNQRSLQKMRSSPWLSPVPRKEPPLKRAPSLVFELATVDSWRL